MHKNCEKIHKLTKDTDLAKKVFERQLAFSISPDGLNHMMEKELEEYTLVDLRDYDDYIKGHIPYAVHVPFDQLEDQIEQFSKDKINILYSYSLLCQKSKKAAYFLASEGYLVKELIGGFKGWKKRDFEIIENEAPDYME